MFARLIELWRDQSGVTTHEYALLLVLVVLVCVLAWFAVGQTIAKYPNWAVNAWPGFNP